MALKPAQVAVLFDLDFQPTCDLPECDQDATHTLRHTPGLMHLLCRSCATGTAHNLATPKPHETFYCDICGIRGMAPHHIDLRTLP